MNVYRAIGRLVFLAMIFFSSLVAFCLVLDSDCGYALVLKKAPTDQKVQAGNDQEKAQSEKKPTPKTEAGKNQTNIKVLRP